MLLVPFANGITELVRAWQATSVYDVARALLVASSTCILAHCAYNIFLHPLKSFPGPLLWRSFRAPYLVRALQGQLAFDLLELHRHYGPIVRIAPNELALAFEGVWDKVQGGTYDNEIPKLNNYYRVQADQTEFIMTAPPEDHAQMRRALSYGFSDRGIRDMESRMIEMFDKMLGRLNDICSGRDGIPNDPAAQRDEAVIDIAKWCNFLTFDMIGELAFGESYNCLETASYHPWVRPIVHLTHYTLSADAWSLTSSIVEMRGHIATTSWVRVVPPDAANIPTLFEDQEVILAGFLQFDCHGYAAESCPDDCNLLTFLFNSSHAD
ncbi:hypothetical protein AALT_g11941 [Alternaria alternata]|nr:hypothetical protein AALT_g11941 [Alternaria alternata]